MFIEEKNFPIPFREKIGIDFEIFAYKRGIGLWMLILFFGTINQSYLTYWIFELDSGTYVTIPVLLMTYPYFWKLDHDEYYWVRKLENNLINK